MNKMIIIVIVISILVAVFAFGDLESTYEQLVGGGPTIGTKTGSSVTLNGQNRLVDRTFCSGITYYDDPVTRSHPDYQVWAGTNACTINENTYISECENKFLEVCGSGTGIPKECSRIQLYAKGYAVIESDRVTLFGRYDVKIGEFYINPVTQSFFGLDEHNPMEFESVLRYEGQNHDTDVETVELNEGSKEKVSFYHPYKAWDCNADGVPDDHTATVYYALTDTMSGVILEKGYNDIGYANGKSIGWTGQVR